MDLHPLLMTLADPDASRADRERAAERLDSALRHLAPAVIRRRYPGVPDVVVDEARQKVLLKASLGGARFRGDEERSARSWVARILQHYAIDWLRRSSRHTDIDAVTPRGSSRDAHPVVPQDLEHLLSHLDAAVNRLVRPRDLPTVRANLRCHLEYRAGKSIEEQILTWADPGDEVSEEALRRARDRVYQYRRRGKVKGCEAVAALLETGEISGEDADLLGRILACDGEDE